MVISSVVALPSVTAPSNVASPVTLKISSTTTVPPALSIVKLPDVVSISLSLVTPTCMLPDVDPATVKLVSMSTFLK